MRLQRIAGPGMVDPKEWAISEQPQQKHLLVVQKVPALVGFTGAVCGAFGQTGNALPCAKLN